MPPIPLKPFVVPGPILGVTGCRPIRIAQWNLYARPNDNRILRSGVHQRLYVPRTLLGIKYTYPHQA
ncbi:MAG: hypothetical protein H0X52_00590 [Gemmatimonadetes bacterium]|nr:hypothetical protein [Gemmatimonadota bacterium]